MSDLKAGRVNNRKELQAAGFDAAPQGSPDGGPSAEALDPARALANITHVTHEYVTGAR